MNAQNPSESRNPLNLDGNLLNFMMSALPRLSTLELDKLDTGLLALIRLRKAYTGFSLDSLHIDLDL